MAPKATVRIVRTAIGHVDVWGSRDHERTHFFPLLSHDHVGIYHTDLVPLVSSESADMEIMVVDIFLGICVEGILVREHLSTEVILTDV
jgi:hypothetical protein